MNTNPRRAERGISLVELMIVVAIIGVLAAIAIARLSKATGAAKENSAVAVLRAVSSAQETSRGVYGGTAPLAVLAERGLLDRRFRTMPMTTAGYRVTELGSGETLSYRAEPLGPEHGVRRYYMRADDGLIHFTDSGRPPDASSPTIGTAAVPAGQP